MSWKMATNSMYDCEALYSRALRLRRRGGILEGRRTGEGEKEKRFKSLRNQWESVGESAGHPRDEPPGCSPV